MLRLVTACCWAAIAVVTDGQVNEHISKRCMHLNPIRQVLDSCLQAQLQ